MAAYYKKRKPFILKLFIALFWIVFVIALAFGGTWAYFYFAKNVDIVAAFTNFGALSKPVEEDAIKTITADDATKVGQALDITTLPSYPNNLEITDGQLGAYINSEIANDLTVDFGMGDIKLKDWNFEVLALDISTENAENNHIANITTTFKFDSAEIKNQMGAFPLSLLKGKIPDVLYVTTIAGIEQTAQQAINNEYTINPESITINNLTKKQTANIFNFAGTFISDLTTNNVTQHLANAIIKPLLGESNSLLQTLNQKTQAGYEAKFEFADGNIQFSAEMAQYQVQVTQLLNNESTTAAAIISGATGTFIHGSNVTLTVVLNTGYNFLGWFASENAAAPISTAATYVISNITADANLFAKFEYIEKTITYHNTKDAQNPNPTTYNISSGTIQLANLDVEGYDFKGWYTSATFEPNTKKTSINASALQDYDLYADWAVKTYSITYHLNGGTFLGASKSDYTIETATFTLSTPVKADTEFVGWTGTNLTESTKNVVINQGTTGNLDFTAHWLYDAEVNLWVDGKLEKTFDYSTAHALTPDIINANIDTKAFGMKGYEIKNWYTNPEMTTLFTEQYISGTINLYSTAEYFTNEILFYPYLSTFDAAVANHNQMTFTSRQDLLAWIDYVFFFHITGVLTSYQDPYPKFKLTYIAGDGNAKVAEVKAAYKYYKDIATYQSIKSYVNYSNVHFLIHPGNTVITVQDEFGQDKLVTTEDIADMASITADPQKTKVQPQMASGQSIKNTAPRANNFDDFAINDVVKTISVSNSEQLVHVLEQGYKPIPQTGSDAETIYNLAKNVLRQICNDDMTDAQKLRAIYEWLVLNVEYDYRAVEITGAMGNEAANASRHYKAWFAEGVFLDKMAVCEGYAKAALILSRIEGIPAIIATGKDHAWNKMMVDGKWFTFDATHGNFPIGGKEVISYNTFLFKDSYRPAYQATEYPEIQSTTTYDFYTSTTIWHEGQSFDFHINSTQEMETFVNYAKANATENTFTFEVTSSGISFFIALQSAANKAGLTCQTYESSGLNGQTLHTIIFTKTA
ncbi:MAG: InlB B-repeat-containing protein [Clostridia bacterium]|nr:InlB B-repeat-containing protein [Clostridia bacterium]